ncbi:MAG: hypothetical protein AAGI01_11885 [Myxococcota bacterium]
MSGETDLEIARGWLAFRELMALKDGWVINPWHTTYKAATRRKVSPRGWRERLASIKPPSIYQRCLSHPYDLYAAYESGMDIMRSSSSGGIGGCVLLPDLPRHLAKRRGCEIPELFDEQQLRDAVVMLQQARTATDHPA